MNVKNLFKRKPVQIAYCVVCSIFIVYFVHGFVDLVHQAHARYVEEDFAAAVDKLEKSPPGIPRVETFIANLKAIDTTYAPADVKQALHDYISALQKSFDALKAGRDTKPYDKAIAEARQRLIKSVEKCE
ncbi:MAG TPA: hypothetical protein VKA67_12085 [Verrucomicrobiae bacterium]|nr:hypothetical protein [Verrucomicrobiae bacterium]